MVPSYIMLKNFAVMCVTCSKIYTGFNLRSYVATLLLK